MDAAPAIAILLGRMAEGDQDAKDAVFEHFYNPMRQLARALLCRDAVGRSIQATELVNSLYTSKFCRKIPTLLTPRDFMALARRAMRETITDRGRRRATRLQYLQAAQNDPGNPLPRELELAVEREFQALAARDSVAARIIECKEVQQLTWAEISELTGLKQTTARDRHKFALAWLRSRLKN